MDNLMDGYAPSTRFPTGLAHRLAVRLHKRLTRAVGLALVIRGEVYSENLKQQLFQRTGSVPPQAGERRPIICSFSKSSLIGNCGHVACSMKDTDDNHLCFSKKIIDGVRAMKYGT